MTIESIYLAVVLAGLLFLLYTGRTRPDVAGLLVMLAMMVPWRPAADGGLEGVLPPADALAGFGSPAVIMVGAMFVLSAAMVHTGATEILGRRIIEVGGRSELRLQLTVLTVVTLFSAFVNDTTTVLIWMPLILTVCRDRGYAPSRVLILLAYASLLGGQWTLIGTRSNILTADYLRARTGQGLDFFAFTPIAVAVAVACIAYFLLLGRRSLPRSSQEPTLASRYEVAEYVTEVIATPDAATAGRTLGELGLDQRHGVTVLEVVRGEHRLAPSQWMRLFEGDVLVVRGRMESIPRLLAERGLQARREMAVGDRTLFSVDLRLAEAVVAPQSPLEGHTLKELDFDQRFGVSALAIAHHGASLKERPLDVKLAVGDAILLLGHERELDRLAKDPALFLLESRPLPSVGRWRAWATLALLALVAVTSATKILEPAFVIPAAAVAALLLGCVGVRQAYASLDLQALVIVGAIIPFGTAIEHTGTAKALGEFVAGSLGGLGPAYVLGALLLAATLLTQFLENAAVAIVLAPVAYELAASSGGDPAAFLTATAICISSAFTTPIAHESTILVMGAGRYSFRDYLRLGAPFAAITWIVTWGGTVLLHRM